MNIEILGLIAGSLSCLTFLPQTLKTWKLKSAKDISATMFIIATGSTILWLIYGILIKSAPLVFTNIIVLILSITMLVFKLTFQKK